MSWQEGLVCIAIAFKGFQLGSTIDFSILVVTDVQRYNSYRIACNKEIIFFLVIKGKSIDSIQLLKKVYTFLFIQGKNYFAV